MDNKYFNHFASTIRNLTTAELRGNAESVYQKLTMAEQGGLRVCYTPFEHINPKAKVVLVGITPGKTQFVNGISELRRQLDSGANAEAALIAAKSVGAFSGPLRNKLVEVLDHVGVNRLIGEQTTMRLFDTRSNLVHSCSLLRNAVFNNGKDYNGTPNMFRTPILWQQLQDTFLEELRQMPNAILIPLGSKVSDVFERLIEAGALNKDRVLSGLPHPSGANAERIKYFLGEKPREQCSSKTNTHKIDVAKARILENVSKIQNMATDS